jgi:tetratricopeptide (TPR) repeat protein
MPSPSETQPAQKKSWRSVAALAFLSVATGLVLSPVLLADFIRLDDYTHLFDNPHLSSLAGLGALWSGPYFNLYIPITYSVWWLVTMIAGLRGHAWVFHSINLTVHLANALLVFLLVRSLLRIRRSSQEADAGDDTVALISALVFALHPVQVESVAWISELKGLLATLFGLLGFCSHFRARRRLLPALWFVAAMLCKPSAVVFPVILFVVNRVLLGLSLRRSGVLPALYALLLLPLVFVTKRLQPDSDIDFIPGFAQRLVVATDALAFYVYKLLLPYPLALDYGRAPRFVLAHSSGWVALSALLTLIGVAVAIKAIIRPAPAKEARSLMAGGWTILLLSVAPVLGLVPFGFQDFSTVADHYLYVPCIGVALVAAGVLTGLRSFAHSRRIAATILVVYAGLGFQQARMWRSTESLFSHTLSVNPQSYLGAHAIDEEHLRAGRFDQAIEWAIRSLAINPDYLKAQIDLGLAWAQKGESTRAIDHYMAALSKNPSTVGTRAKSVASLHNNLGMVLLQQGREEEAVEHFRKAVGIFPRSLNAHLNLARVALANHRFAEAVTEFEISQALAPAHPMVQQGLAQARRMVSSNPGRP